MSTPSGLTASVAVDVGALAIRIEIQVAAGETVAVLGPNGAGKTTLLRVLAGLVPLERGSVQVAGQLLDGGPHGAWVEPEQRPIGFVFQDYRLFPHLSVVENVAFGLRARGTNKRAARAAATSWIHRVGLAGREHDRPSGLSGGEAQRVALARALITEPALLLLDEPLSALDATTRSAMRRELRRFLDAHHGARIIVTHDPVEAMAVADRLVIVEGGRVVQEGSPWSITARPRSAYVADLVGVNLFAGRADDDGTIVADDFILRSAQAEITGDVFAVVHPRAVAIHRQAPEGSARNVWPAIPVSVDVEDERARVRLRLRLGNQRAGNATDIVAEVTLAAAKELRLTEGGSVWASVKATEVTVYRR